MLKAIDRLKQDVDLLVYYFLRYFSVSSKFVSSAQWCALEFLTDLFKSFMKIIKRRGPNTDPCGTPWELIFVDSSFRSIKVYCILPHIKYLCFSFASKIF